MTRLLIIADDFTGALDTGVQLASGGIRTCVMTRLDALTEDRFQAEDVLVIDAETRHLSPEDAYGIVFDICRRAESFSVPFIYKKTDSVLRGNIGAELSALMDGTGTQRLPFIPAFPCQGRVTMNGVHYVNGVPLAESVFGNDPFDPVDHSRVEDIIHQQTDRQVYSARPGEDMGDEEGIYVFDAVSDDDLRLTGARLAEDGDLHIMAGCAGFAAGLPELLDIPRTREGGAPELSGRMLVICGSVNPVTRGQLDCAEEGGFARYRLTPKQKLDPDFWESPEADTFTDDIRKALAREPLMIIDTNDEDDNLSTRRYAAANGLSLEDIRERIAWSLGRLLKDICDDPHIDMLFITGGDTLFKCMEALGVHEMEPICELTAGVVVSAFTYEGRRRMVISKSGGFGSNDLLLQLAGIDHDRRCVGA